jgi:hypothetical protein
VHNQFNFILRNINKGRLLNHIFLSITETIHLSLEVKFVGNLFKYVDQSEKIWRQRMGVKSDQGIKERQWH